MIRARLSDGRFLLGFDAENIRRLQAGEGIVVDLSAHGGTDRIIIVYGNTLADIMDDLTQAFGTLPPAQPMPPKQDKPS